MYIKALTYKEWYAKYKDLIPEGEIHLGFDFLC